VRLREAQKRLTQTPEKKQGEGNERNSRGKQTKLHCYQHVKKNLGRILWMKKRDEKVRENGGHKRCSLKLGDGAQVGGESEGVFFSKRLKKKKEEVDVRKGRSQMERNGEGHWDAIGKRGRI